MKDLMFDWVERHKGENPDGTWFVLDCDPIQDVFPTEDKLVDFLWDYVVKNPEVYLPYLGEEGVKP